jgi:hypothetical protein
MGSKVREKGGAATELESNIQVQPKIEMAAPFWGYGHSFCLSDKVGIR